MSTAVVVGSGPNGLAAALTLAQQRIRVTILEAATAVGAGTRTSELTLQGLLHDDCSAVHPMTVASPSTNRSGSRRPACVGAIPRSTWPIRSTMEALPRLHTSIDATTAQFDRDDARAWRRLFAPLSNRFDELLDELVQPIDATTRNTLSDLTDRNESWINRAFSLPAPQPESAERQLSSSPARATASEHMTSMKRD